MTILRVSDHTHGPYVLVVTSKLPDEDYPMVVGPPKGWATKEEALEFAKQYENDELVDISVVKMSGLEAFINYMSW